MSAFVIYALPVQKGILGVAPMPGVDGQYAHDLKHLKDWKPAMVLSMTETAELETVGAASLATDLLHSGTRWFSFPVPTAGIGGPLQEDAWHVISETALAALRGGGRVLVHSRSGKGRSCMAALRLMIAAGEGPKVALKRLRSVRPGAVETREQQRWAR